MGQPAAVRARSRRSSNGGTTSKPSANISGAAVSLGGPPMLLSQSLQDACAEIASSLTYNGSVEVLPTAADVCVVHADRAALIVLIVTEAVRNAITFAHPTGVAGRIAVGIRQDRAGAITIEVTDDGVGLPEGFDPSSDGNTGFRLMRALADRTSQRTRTALMMGIGIRRSRTCDSTSGTTRCDVARSPSLRSSAPPCPAMATPPGRTRRRVRTSSR